jgi:A/G-specific adenine glycosylase
MTGSTDEHPIAPTPLDAGGPPASTDARVEIHARLLAWYAVHGRATLPWRHTRDPYAILVAEVMLQQTQVERVLPKYHAFLARFPALTALAAAPASDVIKAWAGLGYNLRAVRLQAIAREAMERYGGALPNTLDGLLALAGIGRYTAGAVACFAFGLPVATVDTNIRRVLWRLFRGIEPAVWPSGVRAARDVLALAEWALPPERAYDWQQALMDLGATVCLSRRPLCERCPLTGCCAAYAETARVALFPSGEALARLRDARAGNPPKAVSPTTPDGLPEAQHATLGGAPLPPTADTSPPPVRVAETPAAYHTASNRPARRNRSRARHVPLASMPEDTPAYWPARPDRVGAMHTSPGKRTPLPSPTESTPVRRRKEPSFAQSSRYYRGRTVAALRALAPGQSLTLAALGPQVKDDYTSADLPWLQAILSGLARDGLVHLTTDPDGAVRAALPE